METRQESMFERAQCGRGEGNTHAYLHDHIRKSWRIKVVPFWKTYQEAPIASGLPMYNKVAIGSQKLWAPIIPLKLIIFTVWVFNTPLGHSG